MKNRVIVMNGQRILQTEEAAGKWKDIEVKPAGGLKPGIYNIHLAKTVDKKTLQKQTEFIGQVINISESAVIQQKDKEFFAHKKELFDSLPAIGSLIGIKYDNPKKLSVSKALIQKPTRKLSI